MVWPIGRHSNYSFLVAFARILHPLSYIIDTTPSIHGYSHALSYALLALRVELGPGCFKTWKPDLINYIPDIIIKAPPHCHYYFAWQGKAET